MLKVYEFQGFPNPARVRIALAEKNALDQVQFVSVDVPGGEHRGAAYLAKNPSGTVPALELDDGTVVSECTAITEFIDHQFPGPRLSGETPRQRAVIHMMQRRAEQRVLDAVGAYFHHATPGLGPQIELYQNADWGRRQRQVAIEGMRYFDQVLAASPYVAGEVFSMADITLFAGLGFADFAKIEIPAECAHLRAWRAKVAARKSVAG
jgi:glutathione S-transferase